MTMQTRCDLCGNPTDPTSYACSRCADETAHYLRDAVALAGEVETNVARLARYATNRGRRAPLPAEGERDPMLVNRRHPVPLFAWSASRERPKRGGLRQTPLPIDMNASARAADAFNSLTTWARAVAEDRGQPIHEPVQRQWHGPLCNGGSSCDHGSCHVICDEVKAIRGLMVLHPAAVAARFLLGQLDWIRRQQFADEAFEQLRAAGATIRRIVDRPADEELVGVCDCGSWLYARRGVRAAVCACGLSWDVQEQREWLMDALRDWLVTAAEATTLCLLAYPQLQRVRLRNLIKSWVRMDRPNHLIGRPSEDGPRYPFGEILDRVSRSVVLELPHDRASVTAS